MVPEQKRAWFVLAVFVVALAGFVGLAVAVGPKLAFAAFGLCGVYGLTPLLFRKRPRPGEVPTDERDRAIAERATAVGGMASYAAFVAACMVPWAVCALRGRRMIDVLALPYVVVAGMVVLFVARAVTVLVLYGREGNHGAD